MGPLKVWNTPGEEIQYWIDDNRQLFILREAFKGLNIPEDTEIGIKLFKPTATFWKKKARLNPKDE